jgi:hypothetical protein
VVIASEQNDGNRLLDLSSVRYLDHGHLNLVFRNNPTSLKDL